MKMSPALALVILGALPIASRAAEPSGSRGRPATEAPADRAGVGTKTVNVIVLCYDPVLKTVGQKAGEGDSPVFAARKLGQSPTRPKLHEHMKWSDPWKLTERLVEDVRQSSYGYVQYKVVEKIDYDGFPTKRNGFTYDEQRFLEVLRDPKKAVPGMTGFRRMFEQFDLPRKIREKDVAEIWLWGSPWFDWDELHWKTPGDRVPYQTDNPWFYRPYDIPDLGRTIWIMGFSYERGESEMLESYGHRIESMLSITVGRGVWDHKRNRENVWNRFTRTDAEFPGESEVGSVHAAPNSAGGYDWSNRREVWTYADDWLTYPQLPRKKRLLNAQSGGWDGGVHHGLWWMRHLPHSPGVTDGFYNNWWQYIVNYDEALKKQPPPGATFRKAAVAMYAGAE